MVNAEIFTYFMSLRHDGETKGAEFVNPAKIDGDLLSKSPQNDAVGDDFDDWCSSSRYITGVAIEAGLILRYILVIRKQSVIVRRASIRHK